MELRTILDWDIAPKLRGVPGVVEVNTHGGELKTYEVEVDSDKLTGYHIPLRRVIEALEKNNANAGGAYLERSEQQSLIRGEGLIGSLADIENIVVGNSPRGTPILIRNIGSSSLCADGASGIRNSRRQRGDRHRRRHDAGRRELAAVADRVKNSLADIQRLLPQGVGSCRFTTAPILSIEPSTQLPAT